MTKPQCDAVRELVEQAREQRRLEQPPPELIEAALGRLYREDQALMSARAEGLGSPQSVGRRLQWFRLSGLRLSGLRLSGLRLSGLRLSRPSLLRITPGRLGLAMVLALAVFVSWGARREAARAPHQDAPAVALSREPAPVTSGGARGEAISAAAPSASFPAPGEASPSVPALQPGPAQTAAGAGTEPASAPARSQDQNCKRPFWIDDHGIKRLKHACLSPAPGCEPPWFADAEGVLRMKPGCSSSAAATSEKKTARKQKPAPQAQPKQPARRPSVAGCEPPWYTDARGIQRLKPKCL